MDSRHNFVPPTRAPSAAPSTYSVVPPNRAPSAAPSMAASDLTFYTCRNVVHDVETLSEERPSPPPQQQKKVARTSSRNSHRRKGSRTSLDRPATAQPAAKRRDSGYGSTVVTPRVSVSQNRPLTAKQRPSTSGAALRGDGALRSDGWHQMQMHQHMHQQMARTTGTGPNGPSARRRVKSYHPSNEDASLEPARPVTSPRHSSTFFHFPAAGRDSMTLPQPPAAARREYHGPSAAAPFRARSRSRQDDYQTIDESIRPPRKGLMQRLFGSCMSGKEGRASVRHPSPDSDDFFEEKRAPHPAGWQGAKAKQY